MVPIEIKIRQKTRNKNNKNVIHSLKSMQFMDT